MPDPHTPPTQAELDALKELDAEATPGPFVADINIYGSGCKVFAKDTEIASVNERLANLSRNQAMANAMFFAHARTELPRLITEVERLRTPKYSPSSETIDATISELARLTKEVETARQRAEAFIKTVFPEKWKGNVGRYTCICSQCDTEFIGDKRDVTCPRCEIVGLQSRFTAAEARVKELEEALRFYSNPEDWTQCEAMTDIGSLKQGEPMMVFEPGEDHPWSIAADALRAELDKLKGTK